MNRERHHPPGYETPQAWAVAGAVRAFVLPPLLCACAHWEAMMPQPLNELERRVLDYLIEYTRSNTYQPSIREIGREFAIKSTKTVSELLQSLADKGWIERDPSRSRGVRLLGVEMRGTFSVPVTDPAEGDEPSRFELDRRLVGATAGAFLATMHGNHLMEDCVRNGDLLLVEPVEADQLKTGD